ncbi:hypothetical protein VP01_272g1 [Puccinia sorghi]|uniref:Uncharacterized protein n=1 Tax=Puccinia sorghi TaxID=27349 RepID=A0A0L6V3Y1_9BASI|nr:hypothetical protein VP01_272g1 [Puccinia sorghi]
MSLADLSLAHIFNHVDRLLLNTPTLTNNTSSTPQTQTDNNSSIIISNSTPKPSRPLTQNHKISSTSLTIHPISQALIQPSPHADHRTHSNTISITDPQPPLPQSTNPLISPKTSIEQQFPTHDSSLNNNKNNNNNNNTATTLPNQSNNPSVPETTLPSEQLTSPHPQSITQENTQSKPTTDETTEDIRLQKYMAINLVNQIKTQPTMFFNPFSSQQSFVPQPTANPNHSPTSKTNILASPHPHPPHSASSDKLTSNVGLQINSSFPPQELAISTDQVNPEILYTADPPPHVLPITLFPTNMIFAPGWPHQGHRPKQWCSNVTPEARWSRDRHVYRSPKGTLG